MSMRLNSHKLLLATAALTVLSVAAFACGSGATAAQPARQPLDQQATEPPGAVRSTVRPTGAGVFDERFYTASLPRDAIVPVYEPQFVSPDDIELWPNELVMGVEINGEAHAYPIGLMREREMVNDVVGGVPVLVSW